MRGLIGAWRLLRLITHALHGFVLVSRFDSMSQAERHEVVRSWSRNALHVLGVNLQVQGQPFAGAKLLVSNHVSWLDIAAVHSVMPEARFVSKADVQHWPLVGKLVDGADTLYIERTSKRDALRVVHQAADALKAGDTVAFFPEGTTGPGPELLPFHGNLLQAAIATQTRIQPMVLRWHEPDHRFSIAAQFIGTTTLVQSLWSIACARGLSISLQLMAPVEVPQGSERRELAASLRERMAGALAAS
ncbi:MAG TPA: lysophospholipid acyltransferase family protein [Burkholderiaceae bacterium]|jgi:1-acyl-sn-glycerol-3-phosphate acyltransferase